MIKGITMKKGDFIKIDYIGRLESGEIFDLTDEERAKKENIHNPKARYKPLPMIIGAGFVISGLDKALLDMSAGEKKTIEVKPEDGFGSREPELVKIFPEKYFDQKVNPGMIIDFPDPSGTVRGRVQSVSAGRVRIDFNHPLAGKTLLYEVEIKEEIEQPEKRIEALLDFFDVQSKVSISGNEVEIEAKAPEAIKERISSLIFEYLDFDKVKFSTTFEKQK